MSLIYTIIGAVRRNKLITGGLLVGLLGGSALLGQDKGPTGQVPAQSETKKPASGQPQQTGSTPEKTAQAATTDKGAQPAPGQPSATGTTDGKAPNNVSASARNASPESAAPEATATQGFVNFRVFAEASTEILKALLAPSWALIVLIVLFVLRAQILELFKVLKEAIPDRGFSVDVGTFKLALSDRAPDSPDEGRHLFSRSPFDIDDENEHDGWPTVREIQPQLEVPVSDAVARHWGKTPAGIKLVAAMRERRTSLIDVLKRGGGGDAIRRELLEYVRALEATRFREASQLADLAAAYPALQALVNELQAPSRKRGNDENLLLLAAGVAHLQQEDKKDWSAALAAFAALAGADRATRYAPAGAFWVAASYNRLLDDIKGERLESDEFRKQIGDLIDRGEEMVAGIKDADWGQLGLTLVKGYYLREAYKDLGSAVGSVADHLTMPTRLQYLERARKYLEFCAQDIEGEPASPLDENNLADLYRQLGDMERRRANLAAARACYEQAHARIDSALKTTPDDPAYINTMALLLASEGRFDEALAELSKQVERDALTLDPGDQDQFVDNQLLAAKLEVASRKPDDPRGIAFAIKILESTRAFLGHAKHQLSPKALIQQRLAVTELLAFAYLYLPRGESLAQAEFERLLTPAWERSTTAELRARVGYLTSLVRSSRTQRRRGPLTVSAAPRQLALRESESLVALLAKVPIDATVPDEVRNRNTGSWIDATRAMVFLAEEVFAAHEIADAAALARKVSDQLSRIQVIVAAFDGPAKTAHGRLEARQALLAARILIETDPKLEKETTLRSAEENLLAARGTRVDIACYAELELGWLRLKSAHLHRENAEADFSAATAAFERALALEVPALRREAAHGLATAYSMKPMILRRAKTPATAPARS